MNELDAYDIAILRSLQEDCTRSGAALAAIVGLSQPACWRRVQRLREQGYVRKETALLSREKLGYGTLIYALVKLSAAGRANVGRFTEAIRALPEVIECHALMGAADFLLKIVAADIHAYEQFFFEKLSPLEGVQDITSSIALSEVKGQLGGLPI
ncbi:MAG: Lrp/AsnC family transcriptional regulator [Hyphomonadaceae bacterium]